MHSYTIVNDVTGEEHTIELDPEDADNSRAFWKKLGWSLFEVTQ